MRRIYCDLAVTLAWTIASAGATAVIPADHPDPLRLESEQLSLHAAVAGDGYAGARLSMEFAHFAGSADNADSLVRGLRGGATVRLASRGGASQSDVAISTPTPPMGDVDIYLSLALAKQRLANEGIVAPSPRQIRAALTGGVVKGVKAGATTLPGVLMQRRRGMDWESIARAHGGSLTAVVEGIRQVNRDLAIIVAHLSGVALAFSQVGAGTAQPSWH